MKKLLHINREKKHSTAKQSAGFRDAERSGVKDDNVNKQHISLRSSLALRSTRSSLSLRSSYSQESFHNKSMRQNDSYSTLDPDPVEDSNNTTINTQDTINDNADVVPFSTVNVLDDDVDTALPNILHSPNKSAHIDNYNQPNNAASESSIHRQSIYSAPSIRRHTFSSSTYRTASLVDQNWDTKTIKTNWINKIVDDDNARLVRAEIKGSHLLLYKPNVELYFAKNLITYDESENDMSSEDVKSIMNNEFIQSTSDLRSLASITENGDDMISDEDTLSAQLDHSSIFSSTVFTKTDSLPLTVEDKVIVTQKIAHTGMHNDVGSFELEYKSPTCPHPDLHFDLQTGMILRGNLEAICHTIAFYPSDSLCDKLIEVLPLTGQLTKGLRYFSKFLDLFTDKEQLNIEGCKITDMELELMLRRIRRVLDLLEKNQFGLLLSSEVFRHAEALLNSIIFFPYPRTLAPPKFNQEYTPYLPNSESNLLELKNRLKARKANLISLTNFESDREINYDLSIMSGKRFLEIENEILLYEINVLDHHFLANWNPHYDKSLLVPNSTNNLNPLHFNPECKLHYLGRLVAYHILEDSFITQSVELRAQILSKWIELGQLLCESGNMVSWLGISSVICGLPILRLAETWGHIEQVLIDEVSKKWAPVVFEVRRNEIYEQDNIGACKILVPRGIGSTYAKEDVIPYYGDLAINKAIEFDDPDSDVIKTYCSYLDKTENGLQKWDKYYNHIKNSESVSVKYVDSTTKCEKIALVLHGLISYNAQYVPLSLDEYMTLSSKIELSYRGNFLDFYSTARSPLFLGSYAPIIFPDILPNYHIYDQSKLIGAIGGDTEALLSILEKDDENVKTVKRNRNDFLKHIRDTFIAGTMEFNMVDSSIIFKTETENMKVESKSSNSRPASVLFDAPNINKSKNRVSVLSANSFNLNDYVNTYQSYLKDTNDESHLNRLSSKNSETNKIDVKIKAATIDRLIDLLVLTSSIFGTKIKADDINKYFESIDCKKPVSFQMDNGGFTQIFYSTYRVFYTTLDLINALCLRFVGAKSAAVSISKSMTDSPTSFPDWTSELQPGDQPNYKFVAQIQLGVLEATLEFVTSYFDHFFDSQETKVVFDKFLEVIDEMVVNTWPTVLQDLQLEYNEDYNEIFEMFGCIESTYKQVRAAFIRKSFTPHVGPISLKFTNVLKSVPLEFAIPLEESELNKYVVLLESTISSVIADDTPDDWIDCFGIIQNLFSKSPLSMFNYDLQEEAVHDSLMHFSNIFHWILTLRDNNISVLAQLPIRIQSIFKFYEKVRDFVLMQIVDIEIAPEQRIKVMISLLKMIQLCRIKMKNVKLFEDKMNRSPFIPSFLESILVNTIMLPASRFYKKCWIKAAQHFHPDKVKFDTLKEMLPNMEDLHISVELLSSSVNVCPGWFFNRIIEIACFVPNMDVDNTNLINFDKSRFVHNSIMKIYNLENHQKHDSPYESDFGFLFNLKPFELKIKDIYNNSSAKSDDPILFGQLIKEQRYLIQIEQQKRSLLMKQEFRKSGSDISTNSSPSVNKSLQSIANSANSQILPQQAARLNKSARPLNSPTEHAQQRQPQEAYHSSTTSNNKFKFGFLKSKTFSLNTPSQNIERRSVTINELPTLTPASAEVKVKPALVISLKDARIFPTYRTPNSFTIGTSSHNKTAEHSFQCHNSKETEAWIYELNYAKAHWFKSKTLNKHQSAPHLTFGAPLKFICQENEGVPLIIEKMMNEIEFRGLEEIGLYRKSASLSVVEQVKEVVNKKGDINMENALVFDVHNLTGCIKAFLRELPEPLIPDIFIPDILEIKNYAKDEVRFQMYHDLLMKLPLCNYNLIERLTRHMKTVEEYKQFNKMTSYNLATIMGGSLVEGVKPDNMKKCFGFMNFICEDWMLNYDKVF